MRHDRMQIAERLAGQGIVPGGRLGGAGEGDGQRKHEGLYSHEG